MKKMTKLGLAAMIAAGSMTAIADDTAELRKELAEAQAEVAELKAQLAEQQGDAAQMANEANTASNLPAGIFVPENLVKVKVDRDDDGDEVELKGELESADIKALAQQAQKALVDNGYTVVKESIEKDDEAKLSYEKVTGDIRETIEVEIDKSWLSDKVEYEVEYEKHD